MAVTIDWKPTPAHFYRVYVRRADGTWAQIDQVWSHGYILPAQPRDSVRTYAIRAVDRTTRAQSLLSNEFSYHRR